MNDDTKAKIDADLDDPVELTTEADDEPALSRSEARVAGMLPGQAVYGDDSMDPNDHRDSEHAGPGEHV